ncbi:anaphase-promoting complex subunit 1-like [Dysidea avara]|uniref:anaphase-promoting complex subunit 1-like n=1 Tax=Dysidea avara TaxID=196820 RepID=UPI003327DFBF
MIQAKLVRQCFDRKEPPSNKYTVQYGGSADDEVWSRQPQRVYTSDSEVIKSFYCYFYDVTKCEGNNGVPNKLHCYCVLCQDVIQLFAATGEVFTVPLLFPVEAVWPMDGGLLIERTVTTTPHVANGNQSIMEEGLPVMFTLLHPLDDMSPIVCRYPSTGSSDQSVLGYQCDPHMIVVHSSCDPSLVVCCDVISGRHTVWSMRPATDQDIPPVKNSIVNSSGCAPPILNLSDPGKFLSSPSLPYPLHLTPAEHHHQKGNPLSRRDSPHCMAQRESPFGAAAVLLSTRQPPRPSPHKPVMPPPSSAHQVTGITPRTKSLSPVTLSPYAHTFQSSGSSWSTDYSEELSLHYLLLPKSCLKLVWEETNVSLTRSVTRQDSTQVFFTEDICGQKYLAMLFPVDKQLRLLECSVRDDHSVQFGMMHDISASHAVPVKGVSMMVVLSTSGVLLYSGHSMVGEVCVDGDPSVDMVTSVSSDCNQPHFTMVTSSGNTLHCSLSKLSTHSIVCRALTTLVQVLPTAEARDVLLHHYQYSHGVSYGLQWSAFQLWLTTMMGIISYPSNTLQSADNTQVWQKAVGSCDPSLLNKIPALSHIFKRCHGNTSSLQAPTGPAKLLAYDKVVTFALHLLYEDMKLNILYNSHLEDMAALLHHITSQLHWEQYVDHYCRDFPQLFTKSVPSSDQTPMDEGTAQSCDVSVPITPPNIMQWLLRQLEGKEVYKFPIIDQVTDRLQTVIKLCSLYCWHANHSLALEDLVMPVESGQSFSEGFKAACECYKMIQQEHSSHYERVVLCLTKEGFSPSDLTTLPVGVSLMIQDCITKCQHAPPPNWPLTSYNIIGREDIVRSLQSSSSDDNVQGYMIDEGDDDDGMKMDFEVLNLRFKDDLRVTETRKLLRSSQPARIAITQQPSVSDHEFIEQQETRLLAVCQRTMALPVGRGMLTLSTCRPIPTSAIPIPLLNLSGRAPPRNTTIGTDHIGVPANMEVWPVFHNMVAAGLRIMPGLADLDSAWIGYNKALDCESSSNWAGFLLAMGLQGYLSQLTADQIYSITDKNQHELTAIGLLLGLAAEKCGSMDSQVAQLLALHCQPLLPPGSAELDITHSVQVAALASTGLLHMGSAQRHLVEVLLKEIGSPPGPDVEYAVDRESYSLVAGLSLGMVTIGCGVDLPGMTDLDLVDQLYHYINGGIKTTTTSTTGDTGKSGAHLILEGDHVNTHVTTAGAVMALALMFLKTNNSGVATGLLTPDTLYQLEAIRPDFLLLRVLGHSLIMWDSVMPTIDWVQQHLPKFVQQYAFSKKDGSSDKVFVDYETVSQAEVNIIAGCCVSLGFRFAGTHNTEAFQTMLHYIKYLLSRIDSATAVDQAGKSCIEGCINASLLALAMVMSGSGNIEVMRLVKRLRVRISTPEVTYGSHMAIHMSLGLLFLGGGRCSLSTSNKAIAAMLCSFYPKFPSTSMDNKYHLQALRHLYVLATEPRVLVTVDSNTGKACSVPVCVTASHGSLTTISPCIVPSWGSICEIKINSPRYWSFTLDIKSRHINVNSGIVFVKKRVGHLSYELDKEGRCGDLSLAAMTPGHHRAVHVDTSIDHNDPSLKYIWSTSMEKTSPWNTFYSNVLTECIANEKLNVIPIYLQLESLCKESLTVQHRILDLWQLKFCQSLCSKSSTVFNMETSSEEDEQSIMSEEYLHSIEMSLLDGVEAKGTELCKEEGLDVLLKHYITGDQTDLLSSDKANLLATALLLYDIPSKHIVQLQANTTLPDLYLQLKSLGVSAAAVTRLLPLLQF